MARYAIVSRRELCNISIILHEFMIDGVPPDGVPFNITTTIAVPLMVVTQTFAIIGIILAIFCLAFNIIFRNRKYETSSILVCASQKKITASILLSFRMVRLTSPNLNYLIVVGAVFIYLSVLFLSMPFLEQQLSTVLCNLQQWLFSFGSTLCFAVVLAKMGRVYYIFSDPTPNRKVCCLIHMYNIVDLHLY